MRSRRVLILAVLALSVSLMVAACPGKRMTSDTAPEATFEKETLPEGVLRVGAAWMDITPKKNAWLAGFDPFRRSKGVHDPITVQTIVLEKGGEKVALVVTDLLGLMKPEIEDVRDMLPEYRDDPVIVGATHVHSAPDTMGLWGGVSDDYMEYIQQAIAITVREADMNAVPARVKAGTGEIPDGAIKNIRITDMLDLRVEVLQFVSDEDDSAIATLVNYACHPEVLWNDNKLITSDFVHYLREGLAGRDAGVVVYFNGAQGAMITPDVTVTHKNKEVHTFDEAQRITDIMLQGVNEAIDNAEPVEPEPIKWAKSEFLAPVDNDLFKKAHKLGLFKRMMYRSYRVYTETVALRIGEVIMVTMPGEARPDIGLRVKEATDSPHPFFLGITQDELGYIMPAEAFEDPLFTYEVSMSPGEKASEKIVKEAIGVVESVK